MVTATQRRNDRNEELAEKYIRRVRNEPLWFCQDTLNHKVLPGEPTLIEDSARSWELDGFQKDLLNAVADIWRDNTVVNHERKTNISVVAGHGPGKTHTAALIAHYFNACWQSRVIITAPKFDQVKTRLFAAIHKIDMRAEAWYRATHHLGETFLYWYNHDGSRNQNWCMLGETAVQPENLAGHHEAYQLVIVEEATGVPESLFPVIKSALSTGRYQVLVMISNATKRTGTFANSHLKASDADDYFRYRIGFENSARVSRKWADWMIRTYGRDSPVVKVRVLGEFAADEPGQLIALQWIVDARNGSCESDGSLPRRKISIDVGAGGDCKTVMTLCEHYQTKVVGRRQRDFSFELQTYGMRGADEAERLWKEFACEAKNGDTFVVDVIGYGAAIAGELARRGKPVIWHQGGAASSDTARWRNQRVQAYLSCRNSLRDKQFIFDERFFEDLQHWEALEAELTAIRTKDNNDKVEDLETKQELVDRLGFSPDRADSLSMQWSSVAPQMTTGTQQGAVEELIVIPSTVTDGLFRGD